MFDYIVKHRHVNEKQACKFFHQIIQGVEELHKNEITHRDLKPENLLLKASAQGWLIKIVDFGLSNTHDVSERISVIDPICVSSSININISTNNCSIWLHTGRTLAFYSLWFTMLCGS